MRILQKTPREGLIRVRAESADDLWELSHIIAEGDKVRARTERKVAVGADKTKQVRKPMTLTVVVTKTELETDVLRVQGTIAEGPEDLVSFGDHHSIAVTPGTELSIIKDWDAENRQRMEEAAKAKPINVLLVVFDRESATLAHLTRKGHEVITTLSGDVVKKAPGGGAEDFWKTLSAAVMELDGRNAYQSIIAASPAFWTDYLRNALPETQRKKLTLATVSAGGEAGVREALKRPEVEQALETDRARTEGMLVERVLAAIAKDKACYGRDECTEKAMVGQVETLVVSGTLIAKAREEGWYPELDALMENARKTGAEVHVVRHATGQLDPLGGVAGVLRW